MMAAIASTFRPRLFYKDSRQSDYSDCSSDEDLFVDCVDKQLDVFDFLEIERDDTSVSSSSSSSSLDVSDDISCYSSGSTVYLDALDDSLLLFDEESEFSPTERELEQDLLHLLPNLLLVDHPSDTLPSELTEHVQDDQDKDEHRVEQEGKEGNPITHAIHFAQSIWEGSKHTPVGFAVNMTEDVVGGVLGHFVRLVQHDEDKKSSVEQQLAPFSREYPSGQQAVFTLATEQPDLDHSVPIVATQTSCAPETASYLPSDEEDWLPLE